MIRHHKELGEGLAVLDAGGVSGRAAQRDHLQNLLHILLQLPVDPAFIRRGEVAEMDAFRRGGVETAHQIAVDILAHEGNHRGRQLGDGHQRGIQGHIRGDLILRHAGDPIALPAAADIPVAQLVHEFLQGAGGLGDFVVVQVGVHLKHEGVQLAEQPFVHDGQLRLVQRIVGCVKAVDVGIQNEESVRVPQGGEELALALLHRLGVEAVGQPRGGIGVEIPANGVRTVGGERFEGIDRVPFGFGHLLPVFILHMAEDDDIAVRGLVEQQGGDRQQGIEPAAGLIHRFGNEIGRELLLEQLLVFKRIMVLGEGHGAGVEPAVDHLGGAGHRLAAFRAADGDRVYVGAVKLNVVRAVVGKLFQLGDAAHRVLVAAFAHPDI